ncbi:hypothetical protein [Desulfobulbus elongatus]|uniref:hypothetical protein n=1 Tax=Desulfobulbus elongatus TaxID=53332 RepID=UPI0012FB10AA|nr:hypothetical protein [Desulfobulbus elongatus]
MAKYAYYNPRDGHIMQWIDTDVRLYHLPAASLLHECDDDEWQMQHQGEMMVSGGEIVPYVAPTVPAVPSMDAVQQERSRRLAGGYDYDFGDERGTHRIGTTDADMAGWDEVSKAAAAYIAAGDPDAEIGIVTDTGPVIVTAAEWQQVLIAAHQARQPIWMASFALQAMDPIPADFTDDRWWDAGGAQGA